MKFLTDKTENATTAPVNNGFAVAYSIPVSLLAKDIVQCSGQVEVTNTSRYNIGFGHYLVLASSAGSHLGERVTQATMSNITPDIHHHVEKISAAFQREMPFTGYLNLVVYGLSSATSVPLVVEQGYGNLSVVISQGE